MTMEQEWQRYQARVYPEGMPQIQHDELRKSFMAGAAVAYVSMIENATKPRAEALAAMKAMEDDILKELQAYAKNPEVKN